MKNQKQRLFEIMEHVNPDFNLNEGDIQAPDYQLNTYGDLKKLINVIKLKQKGSKIGGVAVDAIIGSIPFLGTAKTAYDVYKAAFNRPDSRKTNTWLDKLDIDDNTSKIVDDRVENGFLMDISNILNSEPDNKPLEQDFNMNNKLVEYLKGQYSGRTVTGIENGQA